MNKDINIYIKNRLHDNKDINKGNVNYEDIAQKLLNMSTETNISFRGLASLSSLILFIDIPPLRL